jgi:hypothetical protein
MRFTRQAYRRPVTEAWHAHFVKRGCFDATRAAALRAASSGRRESSDLGSRVATPRVRFVDIYEPLSDGSYFFVGDFCDSRMSQASGHPLDTTIDILPI